MDTISKRLKDALRTATQEGETYSNEAFRQLIFGKTGMKYGVDYKESHFAGCLSALKKNGEIIQVQRGEYIKGKPLPRTREKAAIELEAQNMQNPEMDRPMSIAQVKGEITKSVQRALTFIRLATQNIVLPFDTPEEDIQYMLKLKELVRKLEEFDQKTEL